MAKHAPQNRITFIQTELARDLRSRLLRQLPTEYSFQIRTEWGTKPGEPLYGVFAYADEMIIGVQARMDTKEIYMVGGVATDRLEWERYDFDRFQSPSSLFTKLKFDTIQYMNKRQQTW